MEIYCREQSLTYNVYHIVKAFFPNAQITQQVNEEQEPLVRLVLEGGACFSLVDADIGESKENKKAWKHEITKAVYDLLAAESGRSLSWGILTGVRPTKMMMQMLDGGMSEQEVVEHMCREYRVDEKKAGLGMKIAKREQRMLGQLDCENGYSLYIGIPFCPSICSYCSFSSSPVDQWQDVLDDYLSALCRELEAIAQMMQNKKLETIYIGGGTPTSLSAEQLERLLKCVELLFLSNNREHLKEYTIEAGRPDSITRDKLEVILRQPVTRISINPQTMQQKTLDRVGRKHTVQQIKDCFAMARELGFDNINMDLIAGLPGETAEDFADTLSQIQALDPDSLTIHSLAIKRAARYGQMKEEVDISTEIGKMIELGQEKAADMQMQPYYMYRQKNIAGNFENVGYAKVDKAGIYNILIMEERQTILAAGAGAATKIVLPEKIRLANGKETDLLRIENVKSIHDYIDRIEEMIERKGEQLWD